MFFCSRSISPAKKNRSISIGETYGLGLLYASGSGIPQSYTEAIGWFRKAAELGHPMAQDELGLMYYNGRSTLQDYAEAAKWFRKAAEISPDAKFHLALMYALGNGLPLGLRNSPHVGESRSLRAFFRRYAEERGQRERRPCREDDPRTNRGSTTPSKGVDAD